MRNSLISDINSYMEYLDSIGLAVSVHGRNVCGLLEHNIHTNPFCLFIKTNADAWEKCIKCQQKVFGACSNDYFFGMCHAGLEEYVFFVDSKTFISVSGYGINREKAAERIIRISNDFHLSRTELFNIYDSCLKHTPESADRLKTLIMPLRHMLSLLQITTADISDAPTKSKTFDSILSFVQRNAASDITIRDIAQGCACSESTVSHLFRTYTNDSVKSYIMKLRMEKAKKFLLGSDLSVTDIALMTGFSNTNYFSTAFRKHIGKNPTEYRSSRKFKTQTTV